MGYVSGRSSLGISVGLGIIVSVLGGHISLYYRDVPGC